MKEYKAKYHLLRHFRMGNYVVVIVGKDYEKSVKVIKNNTFIGEREDTIYTIALPERLQDYLVVEMDCITKG